MSGQMGGGWGQGKKRKALLKWKKICMENIKENVYYKITPISFYVKLSKLMNSDSKEIGLRDYE